MPSLDELRDVFADHPAVKGAYLFGSVARGTARADSDVDVGIVVDEDRWEPSDKLDLLTACVKAGFDWVDVVVLNDAPLVVQYEAVSPNVCWYADDDFDPGAFTSKVLRMYWDFEPYLKRQRKAYKRRRLHQAYGSSGSPSAPTSED